VDPPVFKTYAPGFAILRRVTLLAKSRVFSGRGYAGLQCRSWEWALSGHSRRAARRLRRRLGSSLDVSAWQRWGVLVLSGLELRGPGRAVAAAAF
jgi:hypothetical protein